MSEPMIPPVRKNSREEIRVDLQEYRGAQIASIRVWFNAADGGMRPGREGINFRVGILPEIHEAIGEALEAARARGLLDE